MLRSITVAQKANNVGNDCEGSDDDVGFEGIQSFLVKRRLPLNVGTQYVQLFRSSDSFEIGIRVYEGRPMASEFGDDVDKKRQFYIR